MRRTSYIFSASLHGGIVALALFGLPYWEPKREPEPMVVLAEFAPIAEKTNVPKPQPKVVETKAEPKEEPVPESKPEPKPEPPKQQAVTPPPPPPPPAPEPPKQAEAPKPQPMPEPVPSPKPLPKPKEVVETPEPPKVVEKPKPEAKPVPPKPTQQRQEEKSKTPNFSDVAALVNKMKAPPAAQPQQAPQTASRTPPAAAPRAEGPSNPNQPVSMSEKDFIRKQVEDKWQFDIGAKDAKDLVVRIKFSLHPDGRLKGQPEIVDQARMYMPGQESYRAAAESARRAVLKAEPFQLPPGDKDKWSQDIILNFDPRMMLGG
ncbi:energy transducer TonB [Ferrovibrio terrae]|uniref:energy transducer TonB n=1 Tax=Ferrovibrio terrae TaxID=2594003 RepID=UPI0031383F32